MADPQAASITQLRNIQAKTGRAIAELHAAVAATGLAKHGEKRSWLMEQFELGYGDANTVVHFMGQPLPALGEAAAPVAPPVAAAAGGEAADKLYVGPKAHLRPAHDAVIAVVKGFGPYETAAKKTYLSLRRQKQFAMLGPATKDLVEIGLNAKGLPEHPRLKHLPPGGMCQATTRIGSPAEVDATLKAWLRLAFDAAG